MFKGSKINYNFLDVKIVYKAIIKPGEICHFIQ